MADRSRAMTQVRKFLEQDKWSYADEGNVLRGVASGECCQWQWVAREGRNGRSFVLSSHCPIKVPKDRIAAVAEYLMRANWGLELGNFEIDFSDGEVLFRCSIPIAGASVKVIEPVFYASCAMMDRYIPRLIAVGLGDLNPRRAIEQAEAPAPEPPGSMELPSASAAPAAPQVSGSNGTAGGEDSGRLTPYFNNGN